LVERGNDARSFESGSVMNRYLRITKNLVRKDGTSNDTSLGASPLNVMKWAEMSNIHHDTNIITKTL
jgi:hypothetical protein